MTALCLFRIFTAQELDHLPDAVVGQSVNHVALIAFTGNDAGEPQDLQLLGKIGEFVGLQDLRYFRDIEVTLAEDTDNTEAVLVGNELKQIDDFAANLLILREFHFQDPACFI